MHVVIELDCRHSTKLSEAKLRLVDFKELHDLHDITPFGYYACKIMDAIEREYSETHKVHCTLITNCMYGALMLAEFVKINKETELYRKASDTDLDQ